MRVTRNNKLIKQRSKLGTYASLGGIAVLAGGMVASFNQHYVWLSLVALIAGFLLAQYGNYNLRRYGRSPRPDQVIEESMKGFDDRYHLYAWTLKAPFVLLSPQGIYSFTTRDQTGKISVNGSKWHSGFSLSRALMMFSQEGMGNPTQDAQATAGKLTEWIHSQRPGISINVQPAIVFLDPRAELDVTDPAIPVLDAKSVKKWLRGGGKGDNVRTGEYRMLETLFDEASAGVSE